jgi:hypothetical protein
MKMRRTANEPWELSTQKVLNQRHLPAKGVWCLFGGLGFCCHASIEMCYADNGDAQPSFDVSTNLRAEDVCCHFVASFAASHLAKVAAS